MAPSTAKYTPLPTADENEVLLKPESDEDEDIDDAASTSAREQAPSFPPVPDPRFEQPTPSPWKRAGLLLFLLFLFWLAFQLKNTAGPPKVIHASRYSREHKYRPAASPIITETLKDGRLRIRGAAPTTSVTPTPTPTLALKKKADKNKKKKRMGKKQAKKGTAKRATAKR
ncbi:hypothetical protein B0H10DRAFT_2008995 [Mycena sp. CBHHK59/15]|nr:hypothetical protein B0H10DRAFT_2008995 [Mycena sp. CBHHK59/15]